MNFNVGIIIAIVFAIVMLALHKRKHIAPETIHIWASIVQIAQFMGLVVIAVIAVFAFYSFFQQEPGGSESTSTPTPTETNTIPQETATPAPTPSGTPTPQVEVIATALPFAPTATFQVEITGTMGNPTSIDVPITCIGFNDFGAGEEDTVPPGTVVVGDIVIDELTQYDLGPKENTVAYFEKEADVEAPWGATCFHDNAESLTRYIQDSFTNGCKTSTDPSPCTKVREVIVRLNGEQDARCHYPDGTIQELDGDYGSGTWCPEQP